MLKRSQLTLVLSFTVRVLRFVFVFFLLSPALWSPGGFLTWSSINCKLLLGYHYKKSWVETRSKTCCRPELQRSPLGSTNGPSGLIIPSHSCIAVVKQQITTNVAKGSYKTSFPEGFYVWGCFSRLKHGKPEPLISPVKLEHRKTGCSEGAQYSGWGRIRSGSGAAHPLVCASRISHLGRQGS